MDHNIKTVVDDDGVMLASIDMDGRSMNVFSLEMMDSLERLLAQVEARADIKAVVLTSGKPAFLAGADLDMIRMFTERAQIDTHAQLVLLCGRLGRLFRQLEKSPKPYVAAINGLALGGGLEISLACRGRVVVDDKKAQLGLPEIKLGLLPGAGGTQRLPRLVGTKLGLQMLLEGKSVAPAQALEAGIVDEIAPAEQLLARARQRALALAGAPPAPWDRSGASFDSAPYDFSRQDVHEQIAASLGLTSHQLRKYPAYRAIMDCVVGGWNKPLDEACDWEMDCFVRLIQDPVAGNMVRTLFLNRQRAAKIAPSLLTGKDIQVAVLGDHGARVSKLLEAGRAPLAARTGAAESDTELLITAPQTEHGIRFIWQEGYASVFPGSDVDGIVWLSELTPHGRALEVCIPTASALATDAGIMLARWFHAGVLLTAGRQALLPKLLLAQSAARRLHCSEEHELLAVSLAAAQAWADGGVADTELADVAAVVAGLHPAYTGGPYNYLLGFDAATLREKITEAARCNTEHHSELFFVPARLGELLQRPPARRREGPPKQTPRNDGRSSLAMPQL